MKGSLSFCVPGSRAQRGYPRSSPAAVATPLTWKRPRLSAPPVAGLRPGTQSGACGDAPLLMSSREDIGAFPPLPACGERVMAEPCLRHEVRGSNWLQGKRLPLTLTLSPRKSVGRGDTAASPEQIIPCIMQFCHPGRVPEAREPGPRGRKRRRIDMGPGSRIGAMPETCFQHERTRVRLRGITSLANCHPGRAPEAREPGPGASAGPPEVPDRHAEQRLLHTAVSA